MMVQRGPAVAKDRCEQDEDREQRLATLCIRLQAAARDVRTADDWARCLQIAAQLPAETWANVLLISSQRPDATLVKGYEAWRAAGRHVNRNEQGIEIFSGPRQQNGNRRHTEDDKHGHSWRDADHVTYVWDLSQTSGQPLPARAAPGWPAGAVPSGLWEALCWLARREGFAVEREAGCPDDGTTLWAARRIRVPPGLVGSQAIWALAHWSAPASLEAVMSANRL
jgi:DNA primase